MCYLCEGADAWIECPGDEMQVQEKVSLPFLPCLLRPGRPQSHTHPSSLPPSLPPSLPQDRPLRKNQVMQIQQLIDDVEETKERLRSLRAELATQQHQQQQHQQEELEEDEEEEEEEEEAPPPPFLPQLTSLLAPHWRKMKMRPRFESTSTPHSYLLAASLPSMKLSDLSVTVGARGETLTIRGFRGPTQEEVGGLLRMAREGGREGAVRVEDLLAAGAERRGLGRLWRRCGCLRTRGRKGWRQLMKEASLR